MNTLIAIAYPDAETAGQVRSELVRAAEEGLLRLDDAVVVEQRQDGRIELHQGTHASRDGAKTGAMWGGLIGLLCFVPLLGLAFGAATGALGGKVSDSGVDDDLVKALASNLRPGAAALILLGRAGARDKVLGRVERHGGVVFHTSLSREDEARLQSALTEGAAAS
jgi:uncharacterized membrane protein